MFPSDARPAPAGAALPDLAELPVYPGIALAAVHLVTSEAEADAACAELLSHEVLGFDTESKPTFAKGEVSTGPHLIQFATDDAAWLFPVRLQGRHPALRALLEAPTVCKVGFGLRGDLAQLRERLGVEPRGMLDLSLALPREARNATPGAKTAVARYLGQRMLKSRKVTTSNWANARLSERQILYAADDAQAALRVYRRAIASGVLKA